VQDRQPLNKLSLTCTFEFTNLMLSKTSLASLTYL
jgi:hypothetical protein